ncbi:hypothetical protein IE53DRAFT_363141 [Violaceomyces palustris]|uniref:Uncharacterized protein n=1 Tax=Violaceomyces palustris TaxID=1673888 RepID=A0ACD0NUE3_9BASI|nr:hypothetical protein IE53DRAFT_363141 [Violaceomyces palustris]
MSSKASPKRSQQDEWTKVAPWLAVEADLIMKMNGTDAELKRRRVRQVEGGSKLDKKADQIVGYGNRKTGSTSSKGMKEGSKSRKETGKSSRERGEEKRDLSKPVERRLGVRSEGGSKEGEGIKRSRVGNASQSSDQDDLKPKNEARKRSGPVKREGKEQLELESETVLATGRDRIPTFTGRRSRRKVEEIKKKLTSVFEALYHST